MFPFQRAGVRAAAILAGATAITVSAQSAPPALTAGPLALGAFTAQFARDGTLVIEGTGWPTFKGTWTLASGEITLITPDVPKCGEAGRYRLQTEGDRVRFELVADDCQPRRWILDRSDWRPAGSATAIPPRRITRTAAPKLTPLPTPGPADASWPSFRGRDASGVADGQRLPDRWNGTTGEHILWQTTIPGLGHSSPIVWGDRVFVTSAASSRGTDTFKPGIYGDGDTSADRSMHRFLVSAYDARTGKPMWERVAYEGAPVDTRHIKSTYASATPATDGRLVVAWFGSQGVYAYDVHGNFRWKVDLGHLHIGAYDIPSLEWGPASSPILWNGLVFLQVDTHQDSFVLALNAETGETVWKSDRDELPSWGTPTIVTTASGPELVTNASKLIRGYDPRTGRELWRLGGSSKITAPTPIVADGLVVVASGRAPERPIFAVKPGSRGDLTLSGGATSSAAVAWSKTGRGSYMPTPLAYRGILYVLANNGVFDAYDLATGAEIYRQRLAHLGSGFSASPVAADGKIYVSSEDGEVLVIAAGREFTHLATNSMGDLLMATPALSNGVMYVRSAHKLFAVASR
jgi:outer membrane protein assembly factor BamB